MGKQIRTLPQNLRSIPFQSEQFTFMKHILEEISKVKDQNRTQKGIIKVLLREIKTSNEWHDGEFKFGRGTYRALDLSGFDVDNLDPYQIEEVLESRIEEKSE